MVARLFANEFKSIYVFKTPLRIEDIEPHKMEPRFSNLFCLKHYHIVPVHTVPWNLIELALSIMQSAHYYHTWKLSGGDYIERGWRWKKGRNYWSSKESSIEKLSQRNEKETEHEEMISYHTSTPNKRARESSNWWKGKGGLWNERQ